MLHEMQRRNYSPRTIASYMSCVSSLSRHYNTSPDKLSLDQVKAYLHHSIINKGCSPCFVNQTISAVKILHKDVLGKRWDSVSIIRPKREKRLPVVLSPKEVMTIINAPANLKHRAILSLGYSAGLRISEVTNLKVDHIDSQRMQIRVVGGKGRKDRNTLLSTSTLVLLRKYYKCYRPKQWLFNGQGPVLRQYSTRSIGAFLKRARIKAGIDKVVTFHTLRHCFATHLLEQGTSLQIIKYLMGHASISTTGVYLHVQQYSLDKVVSPMDIDLSDIES